MRNLLAFILLLPLCLAAQEQYVKIENTDVFIVTEGMAERKAGQPVVVFESGHGVPLGNWDKNFADVAELLPVFAYDRPGVGKSSALDYVPNAKNVAANLVAILREAKIDPPYILVGHSLGGAYVRGFANYYPELLAGLIIIDPADFTETLDSRSEYYQNLGITDKKIDSLVNHFADLRLSRFKESLDPVGKEGIQLEAMRQNDFKELNGHPLPDIPVHFLIGGRFDMPEKYRSEEYDDTVLFRDKIRIRTNRYLELLQPLKKGMLFYSGDAGHYVQRDEPELLLSSIKIMLNDLN